MISYDKPGVPTLTHFSQPSRLYNIIGTQPWLNSNLRQTLEIPTLCYLHMFSNTYHSWIVNKIGYFASIMPYQQILQLTEKGQPKEMFN